MRSKAISMALLALALGAQVRPSFAELSADLTGTDEPVTNTSPVRILIPDVLTNLYARLDLALEGVNKMAGQYGPVCVELLEPAELRKSVALNYPCTILATNEEARAAVVTRTDAKVKVTVATNAVLTLSNVAFASSKNPVVQVDRGGRLELSGMVDFGVPLDLTAVQTAATNGLFLAAAIDCGFALDCTDAPDEGLVFGSAADDVAAASAIKIAKARDPNLEVRGVAELGDPVLLKWAAVELPLEESVGYFVDASGVTNTAACLDRLLEKFEADPNARREIVLLGRPGPEWEHAVTVGADLLIRGADEVVIDDIEPKAGFTVTNGTLTVSNVVFRNHTGANSLFTVKGAAAHPARLVLRDSVVANCERSNGTSGYGGAVYLAGAGCSLLLDGATIINCIASYFGGGVYAATDATVELKGATVVKDNYKKSSTGNTRQNIYFRDTDPLLKVVGDLSGQKSVGVFYQGSTTACKEGDTFATVAADILDGDASAEVFFSDKDNGTLEAVYNETEGVFKWRTIPTDQFGQEEDSPEARVKVTSVDDGKVLYYVRLQEAISELTGDAIVELRANDRFPVDLIITNTVTLRTDLEKVTGGAPCTLRRSAASSIVVKPGVSLTVTNLTISGCLEGEIATPPAYTVPLIEAESAELVLQDGATIAHVRGTGKRNANAVTVWNGGTFRMESGAVIFDSANDYHQAPDRYSVGGGLLLDMSTAYLTGGTVSNCAAWRAGGVYVGNRSTAYVSGDFTVVGNTTTEPSGLVSDPLVVLQSDLSVANDSTLVLADVLTGSIGYVEGVNCDTNVFGAVADDFPGDPTESANRFTNNRTFSTGTVAADPDDSEKKLLVWANDGPAVVALPKLVEGLVYTGNEQTGVVARADFALTGNVATDAGMHTATASLADGSVWPDGSSDPLAFDWVIAQATYDMRGVSFTNATYVVDGTPKSIYISGTLPDGVSVDYEGNAQTTAGVFQVIAHFSGDAVNYEPIPDREATMTLDETVEPGPTPPDPPPTPPDYTVTTNDPSATPLAFSAIRRISEDEWELGVTNLLKDAKYALSFTYDLLTPFTTGQWFTAEFSGPTNMIIKFDDVKPACFWRIHGRTTYVTNWIDTVGP